MYRISILLVLFVCYFPVSTAEESRPSQTTQLYMMDYGSRLGEAEICGFSKTKEFESRFKKSLDATKWEKADKDMLWNLFELARKKMHDNPDINDPEAKKENCPISKGVLSDTPVFKDNFKFGDGML